MAAFMPGNDPRHWGITYTSDYSNSLYSPTTYNYGNSWNNTQVSPSRSIFIPSYSEFRRNKFPSWRHGQLGIYRGKICYPASILRFDPAKLPVPSPEPRIPTARRSGCRSRLISTQFTRNHFCQGFTLGSSLSTAAEAAGVPCTLQPYLLRSSLSLARLGSMNLGTIPLDKAICLFPNSP